MPESSSNLTMDWRVANPVGLDSYLFTNFAMFPATSARTGAIVVEFRESNEEGNYKT